MIKINIKLNNSELNYILQLLKNNICNESGNDEFICSVARNIAEKINNNCSKWTSKVEELALDILELTEVD